MPTLREELTEKILAREEPAGVKPEQEIPAKPVESAIEPKEKPVEAKAEKPEEKPQEKPGVQRDEQGRFKSEPAEPKAAEASPAKPAPDAPQPEPAKPLLGTTQPPPTWSTEAKALWGQLPEGIRSEVLKREKDQLRGIGQYRKGHESYERIQALAQPFMPLIAAEGGNLELAVKNYLETAATLRLGTLEQKSQLIHNLAARFGVPLHQAKPDEKQVDPEVAALRQRVETMEAERNRNLYQSQQAAFEASTRDQAQISTEIEAFANDQAHPHFEAVREDMAALMSGGRAKTLQEAYDMAVFANPSTRDALLQERLADAERKRKEEEAKRLEAARNAAGSVRGSPAAGTSDGPKGTLRQELEAQFRASGGRI